MRVYEMYSDTTQYRVRYYTATTYPISTCIVNGQTLLKQCVDSYILDWAQTDLMSVLEGYSLSPIDLLKVYSLLRQETGRGCRW